MKEIEIVPMELIEIKDAETSVLLIEPPVVVDLVKTIDSCKSMAGEPEGIIEDDAKGKIVIEIDFPKNDLESVTNSHIFDYKSVCSKKSAVLIVVSKAKLDPDLLKSLEREFAKRAPLPKKRAREFREKAKKPETPKSSASEFMVKHKTKAA
jgi:hypothetical protein